MVVYDSYTSRRLESYAKSRGKEWGIAVSFNNGSGLYFLINVDRVPLHNWVPLGWTYNEAVASIDDRINHENREDEAPDELV